MKIKVCGLTDEKQIEKLINLKIDFLGFIFYPQSPRYVLDKLSVDKIAEFFHVGKVGVFVNEKIEKIVKTVKKADLNYIQLHGNEDSEFRNELRRYIDPKVKLIKVMRMRTDNFNDKNIEESLVCTDYLLFDTDSQYYGGTGKTFDWKLLDKVSLSLPYFLSGGISLENIDQIKNIKQRPFALDVNSKFEISAGVKDLDKITLLKKEA
ncbi:MAG: phosphoribosylanthranilate isomerase [Bergeyella sp.]|nr:phosphoribosylanthranilate isomerase [Bergeyella sp.]